MESLIESLSSWATILGFVLTLFGIVQSRAWLTLASVVFLGASVAAGVYARRERHALHAAAIRIEGRSIDSLNAANLRRVVNRSLVVQAVKRVITIEGQDLDMNIEYSGYCSALRETQFNFSIDSDSNLSFDALECRAYDLLQDCEQLHPIRPILVGPDGVSKKLAVPFLKPLSYQEAFAVALKCTLPRCVTSGIDYYTAALSFAQKRVPRSTVHLVFKRDLPEWVRVYGVNTSGKATLIRAMQPLVQTQNGCEYIDDAENLLSRSARVYMFMRPMASRSETSEHHTNSSVLR